MTSLAINRKNTILFLFVSLQLVMADIDFRELREFWKRPEPRPQRPSYHCATIKPIDLRALYNWEVENFHDSYDTVIVDIEAVLLRNMTPITGAIDTLNKLRDAGKYVLFVTNNSIYPVVYYLKLFSRFGYESTSDEFILPSTVILWHLQNTNFQGKLFVFGTKHFKEELEFWSLDLITGPNVEDLMISQNITKIDPEVKAVIFEYDNTINLAKINQAAEYLKNKSVQFFVGALDESITVAPNHTLIGPAPFAEILTKFTGRTPISYAKPSAILKDYIFQNYVINGQAERYLFIGDSLSSDMKFADLCGFTKLWITMGIDPVKLCKNGCEGSPDYYLPDLSEMPFRKFI